MTRPDDQQDDDLLRDASRYDQEVQRFFDQHHREVHGYLINLGTPAEHIRQIVHDAFLAARDRWLTLRTQNPRAYVFQVARYQRNRTLRNEIRRSKRVVVGLPFERGREWEEPAVPDHADDIIDRMVLNAALAKLSENHRNAVLLHHVHGFPVAETAKILNRAEATVKSDLRRGRDILERLLSAGEEAKEQ